MDGDALKLTLQFRLFQILILEANIIRKTGSSITMVFIPKNKCTKCGGYADLKGKPGEKDYIINPPIYFQCPKCGNKGKQAQSAEQAIKNWNNENRTA